jgi:hypothetical protein
MKCGTKKMAKGGTTKYVKPQDRMPAPQSDKELDKISPEALKMMEQKKRDVKQEKQQKNMENTVKKAKGGSVSKRADGCATKGKTKGRMV